MEKKYLGTLMGIAFMFVLCVNVNAATVDINTGESITIDGKHVETLNIASGAVVTVKNSSIDTINYTKGEGDNKLPSKLTLVKCNVQELNGVRLPFALNELPQLEVTVNVLDVPAYNQYNTPTRGKANNLCWASSLAMFSSYYLDDSKDRTLQIAKQVTNEKDGDGYNKPYAWVSTDKLDLGVDFRQKQRVHVPDTENISMWIDNNDPFGVLSGKAMSNGCLDCGHWVVGVGYIEVKGEGVWIVSNDPNGGVQNTELYEDFKRYDSIRCWGETAEPINMQ